MFSDTTKVTPVAATFASYSDCRTVHDLIRAVVSNGWRLDVRGATVIRRAIQKPDSPRELRFGIVGISPAYHHTQEPTYRDINRLASERAYSEGNVYDYLHLLREYTPQLLQCSLMLCHRPASIPRTNNRRKTSPWRLVMYEGLISADRCDPGRVVRRRLNYLYTVR